MSKFSQKHSIKVAEKALVQTFPVVKIDGETYRIAPFAGDVAQVQQAMAIAEELLPFGLGKVESGVISFGMRMELALPSLAAMLLVHADGSKVMEDIEDFRAWQELTKTEAGEAALLLVMDRGGINEWLATSIKKAREAKQIKESSTENAEEITPEEVAIKN